MDERCHSAGQRRDENRRCESVRCQRALELACSDIGGEFDKGPVVLLAVRLEDRVESEPVGVKPREVVGGGYVDRDVQPFNADLVAHAVGPEHDAGDGLDGAQALLGESQGARRGQPGVDAQRRQKLQPLD